MVPATGLVVHCLVFNDIAGLLEKVDHNFIYITPIICSPAR